MVEGRRHPGWRQGKGRDESTRGSMEPCWVGKGLSPAPGQPAHSGSELEQCMLWLREPAVCLGCPFFALLPRAIGRPSAPQATSCAALGAASGAMGRESS